MMLDKSKIESYLEPNALSQINEILIESSVDSTNDCLKRERRLPQTGMQICLAEHQTAGKGRYDKSWYSPKGANIYLSIYKSMKIQTETMAYFSLFTALIVGEVLEKFGITDYQYKWPNDILFKGKKLCGILIESLSPDKELKPMIFGVGLNVNMPSHVEISQPWIDLKSIIGDKEIDRNRVVAYIITAFQQFFVELDESRLELYLERWSKKDSLFEKTVMVKQMTKAYEAIALGINEKAELILKVGDELRTVCSAEVSISCPQRSCS